MPALALLLLLSCVVQALPGNGLVRRVPRSEESYDGKNGGGNEEENEISILHMESEEEDAGKWESGSRLGVPGGLPFYVTVHPMHQGDATATPEEVTTPKPLNQTRRMIANRIPLPIKLPVVSRPFQVGLLIIILSSAIFANGSVILNISRDSLKLRMVHFVLIRHLMIADLLGALIVLPVPLLGIALGEFDWGDDVCRVVSTSTASLWTIHLLAVAFYRMDRLLALWLPTGRYPPLSVRTTHVGLVIVWFLAIGGCFGATQFFGHTFQPALALCIPNVPLAFFVIVFSAYCMGLVTLTTGYIFAYTRRRRKRRKREKEVKLYAEMGINGPYRPYFEPVDLNCLSADSGLKGRRSFSEQFTTAAQDSPGLFTPSKLTHRRVWSETTAGKIDPQINLNHLYSPASVLTMSNPSKSNDSSSFPHSSASSNAHDGETVTQNKYTILENEEEKRSDPDLGREHVLVHSLSLDPCKNGGKKEFRRGVLNFSSSKSYQGFPEATQGTQLSPMGAMIEGSSDSNENQVEESKADSEDIVNPENTEIMDNSERKASVTSTERKHRSLPFPTCPTIKTDCIDCVTKWSQIRTNSVGVENTNCVRISESNSATPSGSSPPSAPSSAEQLTVVPGNGSDLNGGACDFKDISGKRKNTRARTRVKHFAPRGYKNLPQARRALASYAISIGHLLLYLPAMFVVGLKGAKLPPGIALICGLIVYAEFIVQPIAILLVSQKLRIEVTNTIRGIFCTRSSS